MWNRVRSVLRSPQRIAEDLKEERLSNRDQFDLLLASIILYALLPSGGFFETGIFTIQGVMYLVQLGVILHGTRQSFVINAQGDAQNFLARYVCLLTPVQIRVWAFTYAIYFLLGWVVQGFSRFLGYHSGLNLLFIPLAFLLEFGLFLAAQVYIFAQLRSLIRFVSTRTESS
jgi:hypothetical protein